MANTAKALDTPRTNKALLAEWFILLFHFVSFIPVGFLAVRSRRPPVRVMGATFLAFALALALAAGKFSFLRHTAAADVVEAIGGHLGALGASQLSSRRTPPIRDDESSGGGLDRRHVADR